MPLRSSATSRSRASRPRRSSTAAAQAKRFPAHILGPDLWRKTLDLTPHAVLVVDVRSHAILEANKAALTLYGSSRTSLLKKRFEDLAAAREDGSHRSHSIRSMKGNALHIKRTGAVFPVHMDCQRIGDKRRALAIVTISEPTEVSARSAGAHDKESEELLRKSEEKFVKAFMLSPDACSLSSLHDGRYIEVNEEFEVLSGYKRQELIGKTSFEFDFWVDPVQRAEVVQRLRDGSRVRHVELHLRDRAGTIRTCDYSAEFITIDGEPCIISVVHDITETRAMERVLRFQASILNAINQSVIVTDTDGVITWWNQAASQLSGWSAAEAVGQNVYDLAGPGRHDPFIESALAECLTNGTWEGEGYARSRTGVVYPIMLSARVIALEEHGPRMIISIATDISDRLRQAEALKESERWYRELFENSFDPICVVSTDGVILDVNPAGCLAFGAPREHLLFLKLEIAMRSQWEEMRSAAERALHTDHGVFDWSQRHEDGTVRHFEMSVRNFPLRGQEAVLAIGRDISSRLLMERELRASLAEKEVLLQEVHHRVKNNLQIIASLLNLRKGKITDPAALELIDQSKERIELMAAVYEQVYQSKSLADLDFAGFLTRSTRGLFEAYSGGTAIRFTSTLPPIRLALQPAIYLGIIIHELISNAIKHAFTGRTHGEVRLAMGRDDDDALWITVDDDGIGMPPSIDHTTTTSLGLRLVHILTQQLHGKVEFDTRRGTTCTITFPELPS